ncbi:starch-binding domain-containing protein 1 [Falco rusticolus]|uniref:starch-binding domain-containing protein 1 n=1 Tax=Falco rusticolus TaxID=120794 RepID=UPI00188695D8|nr:starch-binding domain-containing protein 1 [Falco rusticolus]XP_055562542.1 starch-binding domain-containing protein 1 [Falco cherrug]
MARDRGPPVLQPPAAAPRPAALPAEGRASGWLGAGLWPALLVGLLAALVAWFWYGGRDGRGEEGGRAAAGEGPRGARSQAAAAGEPPGSGEPELRGAEAAALALPRGPGEDPAAVAGKEHNHVRSSELLEVERQLPKRGATDPREHPPAGTHGGPAGEQRAQVGSASDGWCTNSAGASDDVCKDASEERPGQPAESRDLDQEEWEVVSEHLAWGEAGKNSSVEDSDSKEWDQGDCPDGDLKAKRVAAVPPMFQNIHVTFRVHYFTHSDAQLIGVTGDHECLGQWHSYVPLKYDKDGFWSESISLPVDTKVEWKFILVENGKVRRWEECGNRTLVTEHEDQMVHQWWGYH